MKNLKLLTILGISLLFVLSSCTVQKRVHTPGFHIDWHIADKKSNKKNINKTNSEDQLVNKKQIQNPNYDNNLDASLDNFIQANKITPLNINERNELNDDFKTETTKVKNAVGRRSGDEVNNFKPKDERTSSQNQLNYSEKQIEPFSLIGFIAGLLGLILLFTVGFPFLLGSAAVVLSIIGLSQFNKEPEKWKGKGFAIAGLILGLLTILIIWFIVIILIIILATW